MSTIADAVVHLIPTLAFSHQISAAAMQIILNFARELSIAALAAIHQSHVSHRSLKKVAGLLINMSEIIYKENIVQHGSDRITNI